MKQTLLYCVFTVLLLAIGISAKANGDITCQTSIENTESCLSTNQHVLFIQGSYTGGYHFINDDLQWTEYADGKITIKGHVKNSWIGRAYLDVTVSDLTDEEPLKGKCTNFDITDSRVYSTMEGSISFGYNKISINDYGINFQIGKNANIFSSTQGYGATGFFKVKSRSVFNSGFINLNLMKACPDAGEDDIDTPDEESTEECNQVSDDDFEESWGIWNDGGSDAYRMRLPWVSSFGKYAIRLRDNSNGSNIYTNSLDLADAKSVEVSFDYKTFGYDNKAERFALQVSNDGGHNYTHLKDWRYIYDFQNGERKSVKVIVGSNYLSSNTVFRFQSFASSNGDKVFLDDIEIYACGDDMMSDSIDIDTMVMDSIDMDSMDMDSMSIDSIDMDSTDMDSTTIDSTDMDTSSLDTTQVDTMEMDSTSTDSTDIDTTSSDSTDMGSTINDSVQCGAVILNQEDFENGLGIWNDGGSDMFRMKDQNGQYIARIRDNSVSSVLFSDVLNLDNLDGIELSFDYEAKGFSSDLEFFSVELLDAEDNQVNYREMFLFGEDFTNDNRQRTSLFIHEDFLGDQSVIRFIGGGNNNGDKIYLDNITIHTCQEVDSIGVDSMVMDSTMTDSTDIDSLDMDSTGVDSTMTDSTDVDSFECGAILIDAEDFENGLGIWNDGGSDMFRMKNQDGQYVARIRDNSNSSLLFSDILNLDNYDGIEVGFDFRAQGFTSEDEFLSLEVMDVTDNDIEFREVLFFGTDFQNNESNTVSIFIHDEFLDTQSIIRFTGGGRTNSDMIYVDNITIHTCQNLDSIDQDSMDMDSIETDSMDIDSSSMDSIDIDSMDMDSISSDSSDVDSTATDSTNIDSSSMDSSSMDSIDIDSMNMDSTSSDSSDVDSTATDSNGIDSLMSSSIDTTVFTEILLEHTEIAFEELANFGILCGENIIDIEDFESDMGIWNDGGSDCFRIWNDTLFGEGEFSMRLRDNSNSSRMFTESLDLTEFEAVTVTLDFITDGFDGNTEEIFMEVSFDGGATFVMVDQLANDVDFNNNEMYRATFLVEGEPFTDNTVLQIRCNASSNADKLYLDNILITGCIETQEGLTEEMTQSRSSEENNFTKENTTLEYSIYPNPSRGAFTIDLADINSGEVEIQVFNTVGAIVRTEIITPEQSRTTIDLQNLNEGLYILKIENNNNIYTERLIISK